MAFFGLSPHLLSHKAKGWLLLLTPGKLCPLLRAQPRLPVPPSGASYRSALASESPCG